MGAPSEAVERVEAGDMLLVEALMNEGVPKHENKGWRGGAKFITGVLIKWITNGELEGECAWTAET